MGATIEFDQNKQLNKLIYLFFYTPKALHEGPAQHPLAMHEITMVIVLPK